MAIERIIAQFDKMGLRMLNENFSRQLIAPTTFLESLVKFNVAIHSVLGQMEGFSNIFQSFHSQEVPSSKSYTNTLRKVILFYEKAEKTPDCLALIILVVHICFVI